MSRYKITKEQCQVNIDKIGGVCPGCGGSVVPIDTKDNSGNPTYWSGCEVCGVFTTPVPERLFNTVQKLIDNGEYRYHIKPYGVSDEELAYWRSTESRGLCSQVREYIKVWENTK